MVIAVLAIVLLLAGGLAALQSATMLSALPFTLIMLLMSWSLLKALSLDVTKVQALQDARITPRAIQNPRSWQQRLGLIMHYPHSKVEAEQFIQQQVRQAFENIRVEFERRHLDVSIEDMESGLKLLVHHQDEMNFIYQVSARSTLPPSFMSETTDGQEFYQAEVSLREGGQNYDVMQWTQDDLLQDIIDQYERHLHFLSLIRS